MAAVSDHRALAGHTSGEVDTSAAPPYKRRAPGGAKLPGGDRAASLVSVARGVRDEGDGERGLRLRDHVARDRCGS